MGKKVRKWQSLSKSIYLCRENKMEFIMSYADYKCNKQL